MNRAATKLLSESRRQRGNFFVELALVLPLMIILFGASVEYGTVLSHYLELVRTVREAAQKGSRTFGLQPTQTDAFCQSDSAHRDACGFMTHINMHQRIYALMDLQNWRDQVRVRSQYVNDADINADSRIDKILKIQVTSMYVPRFFPFVGQIPLSVEVTGAYLL